MRRELSERYGEQKLYEGGLSVRTTLDPQDAADGAQGAGRRARALRRGAWLARALKTIDLGQDWGVPLADIPEYGDVKPWQLAVALDVTGNGIRIGLQPEHDKSGAVVQDRQTGSVTPDGDAGRAGPRGRW